MASVNKVILVGHLGSDPELRYTQAGKAVCNLSIATTDSWTGKDGGRNEKTEWHRIVLWGKTAESAAQYLAKGRQVYVEGRIESRKYEDKGGQQRTSFEIVADRLVFLGSKGDGESGDAGHAGGPARSRRGRAPISDEPPAGDADLPF